MRAVRSLLVLAAAVAAAAAMPGAAEGGQRAQESFGLKEVLDGSFTAGGIGTTQWVMRNSQDHLVYIESGDLVQLNLLDNSTSTLVKAAVLEADGHSVSRGSWLLSNDGVYLLWSYEVQAGFRHSTVAKYAVLDIANGTWSELHNAELLHYATWAPIDHGLAYVHKNDVYYVPDAGDVADKKPITADGEEGVIYNGVPDWAYEEEVLGSGSAMWFSPDGKNLAFAKFNDTNVEDFKYIRYGESQYTTVEELRYPKPGTTNPDVALWVAHLPDGKLSQLSSPFIDEEHILQNVAWARANYLVVTWLNRVQNETYMSFLTPDTLTGWTNAAEPFHDKEEDGWIEAGTPVAPFETGTEGGYAVAVLLSEEVTRLTEKYGRLRHPRTFVAGVPTSQPLVDDASVATAIYRWNRATEYIYYQAAPADLPSQRHVYAVKTTGAALPKCLTCSMTQPDDQPCLYASASISPRTQYAVVTCSGPGPTFVVAARVETDSLDLNNPVRVMQENTALRNRLQTRLLPEVDNVTVPLPDGFDAQVRLWLPPDLDENEKYPMIVYVYGGPGSQQVSDAYSVNWGHYLTTNRSIIYAAIDGRGSGLQGNRRLFALYKKLGTVEVEDQISVAKALTERFPFVDAERVGIWGWSYGGYATAMALARDSDGVFACGASVAPVTDWELYDSIYTERYMQTPQANRLGYDNANVSNKLDNFKSHRFLLMHGNADDNVHYQQSMRLVRELEIKDILFEQESYPDENHSIRSVVQHVYHTMDDFFQRCFAKQSTLTTSSSTSPPGGGGGGGATSLFSAPLSLLLLLVLTLLKM